MLCGDAEKNCHRKIPFEIGSLALEAAHKKNCSSKAEIISAYGA